MPSSAQKLARDRERRAKIRAGTWTFPNGGAAASSLGLSPGNPAPAPRSIIPAPAPRSIIPTPAPVRAPAPAPQSMVAVGGRPGRGLILQGFGYAAPPDIAAVSTFTKWRANTETMLAALAAKSDAQERRIAALEAAAADRRPDALTIAQAIAGLFSFAVRR